MMYIYISSSYDLYVFPYDLYNPHFEILGWLHNKLNCYMENDSPLLCFDFIPRMHQNPSTRIAIAETIDQIRPHLEEITGDLRLGFRHSIFTIDQINTGHSPNTRGKKSE